jgi:hypothetical protein
LQQLIKIFFSPMAFAVGFLWPLVTQVLIAAEVMAPGLQTWLVSAAIVLPFALMAQFRGSWIWIK